MVLQSNEPEIPLFNFNGGLFIVLDVYALEFWINCDMFFRIQNILYDKSIFTLSR